MIHNSTSFGFPPDFSPQIKSPLYEDFQLPIAEKSVIDALREHGLISSGIPVEAVLLCALCTAIYRTHGQTDGTILYIGPDKSASSRRTMDISLEPARTVIESICVISQLLKPNDTTHGITDPFTVSVEPKLNTLFHFVDGTSSEDDPAALCSSKWIFSYTPNQRSLHLFVRFTPNVYSQQSIGMFGRLVERTLKAFSSSPDSPLGTLLMTSCEDIPAIKTWNNITTERLPFKSIGTLITSVSSRLPNNVAVIHGDGSFTLTYSDMDKWSDALAYWLLSKNYGGAEETVVGIWQSRTAFLVISYLACLKSGCAYMPLDMTLPAERLKQMLKVSSCPVVLGYASPSTFPCSDLVDFIDLDSPDMRLVLRNGSWNQATLLPDISHDRLAYVVFTSGSTGVPKAIAIQHGSLVDFLNWRFLQIQEGDRVAFMIGIAFDVSSGEIWYSLSRGATLVCHMQSSTENYDVFGLCDVLIRERVVAMMPPFGILKTLVEAELFTQSLPYLRLIAMGGESVSPDIIRAIQATQPHIRLVNFYGPSEATVYCTAFDIPADYHRTNIPIGRPHPNMEAYVVDENLNLVPPGVCGELLLIGKCLARGYLNRPDLTKEKFIFLPADHSLHSTRAYLSGDIARLNAYGELEFICRKDDSQVKIRGHRLELREIEEVMKRCSGVRSALVVLERLEEPDSRLIGYFTGTTSSSEIALHLHRNLPSYMVPFVLINLPEIPLGITGKLNRNLLSDPSFIQKHIHSSSDTADDTLLDDSQMKMRKLFSSALGIPENTLSVSANLFELGGHSLTATRILIKIQKEFNVKLQFGNFMKNPSVLGITELVTASQQGSNMPNKIECINSDCLSLPASDAQARLWVEEQMHPGLTRYNTIFQRCLTGPLQIDALHKALLYLVHRHEPLRTTFDLVDGALIQSINAPEPTMIKTLSFEENAEIQAQEVLSVEASTTFDLAIGLPSRFLIVKVSEQLHYLSIVLHHICTDGWSMGIIEKELSIAYNSYLDGQEPRLRPLPLRYRDYSMWAKTRQNETEIEDQLQYWARQLKGAAPLELPLDFIQPKELSCHWDEVAFNISASCIETVHKLASNHITSLFSVLLAAFRATLYRMTGAEDGNLATVNANRTQPGLEEIVGFFVNTQAIRLMIDEETSFNDLILQSKSVLGDAVDNADAPFDRVVSQLSPKRDISRNSLARILFVLHDFSGVVDGDDMPQIRGVEVEEIRRPSTRLDISVHLFRKGASIRGHAMYQADLFSRQTIQTLVNLYLRILDEASRNAACPLSLLPLVTEDDLQKFTEWNDTSSSLNQELAIHERFREVVLLHGPDLAIVDDCISLTYSELDTWSDCLASWLLNQNVPLQSVVGIWMRRSALLVVAYLACLKAGLAYMPLDKSLPNGRLSQMIYTSECKLVLSFGSFPLRNQVPFIDLSLAHNLLCTSADIIFPKISPRALSNIIFTSGSTGVPKGVMVEHLGMLNLCSPETSAWPDKSRNALTSGIGFDPSGFQIFATLLSGSELHILRDDGIFDTDEFQSFLIKSRVQKCYLTPSVLTALLKDGSKWLEKTQLNSIMLGGERLEPAQIAECYSRLPGLTVWSSYGPAEASVRSAFYVLPPNDFLKHSRIPLGRALPNTKIHVVDKNLQLVPPGVIGEIVVSGIHITRGYISHPTLTDAQFLHLPRGHPMHPRIYRTGDLGYWTAGGLLQYVGRADAQLKIRGQRIEAGEIESLINRHPSVQASAVVVPKIKAAHQLVAYIQLANQGLYEEGVLKLWDSHYNAEDPFNVLVDTHAGHDFARWFSMFDGERIPFDQMEEWLQDTLHQIAPARQDRVLEVGVGTGMIALGIIDQVTSYMGTDISSPSLAFLQKQVEARGLVTKLSVKRAAAHELEDVPNSTISLVVINSVIQYFPSVEYLTHVLKQLLNLLEGGGRIFLGDLRSYSLITLHDLERALGSLEREDTTDDVQTTINAYAEYQAEFLVDPSFFLAFQQKHNSITYVEVRPKAMKTRNELSRYRYSVVLHINSKQRTLNVSRWINYSKEKLSPDALRSLLRSSSETNLGVSHIPQPDLAEMSDLLTVIRSSASPPTVYALRNLLKGGSSRSFSMPATLNELAAEEGWKVSLDYTSQTVDGGYLRAIFYRSISSPSNELPIFPPIPYEHPFTNTIKKPASDHHQVFDAIKDHLQQHLPDSMLPTKMINVNNLPLNRSGKLDRPLLSSAEFFQQTTKNIARRARRGPSNPHEEAVLVIFSKALRLPPQEIDVEDSLFDLGGHSLMATTVVTAIRRELNTNLSMVSFFRHPTIKAVATIVSSQTEHASGEHPVSENAIDLLKQTIYFKTDHPGPALFMFPETTGFGGVYTSAVETIDAKIIAFGDEGWGDAENHSNDTIESIGKNLVQKILQIQSMGPFYLAGWSFGGYLAYEVALQLKALGHDIRLLSMFDTSVYDGPLEVPQWRAGLEHLLTIIPSRDLWLTQFARVNDLISKYKIGRQKYSGKVVLVKALKGRQDEDGIVAPSNDPANGWRPFLPQLIVHGLDSTHRRMFSGENGKEMGRLISKLIHDA
ncbi:hypothetical protein M422DRAFT_247635 [Sphaerobolus stellatus SS14]|nr:hypothetical protein M422DRAFT_247635 [Sphaerobolus stellatus SS14]